MEKIQQNFTGTIGQLCEEGRKERKKDKQKVNPYFSPYTKINTTLIIDQILKPKNLNVWNSIR